MTAAPSPAERAPSELSKVIYAACTGSSEDRSDDAVDAMMEVEEMLLLPLCYGLEVVVCEKKRSCYIRACLLLLLTLTLTAPLGMTHNGPQKRRTCMHDSIDWSIGEHHRIPHRMA